MIIGTCTITMRAEWVTSLKEKRMVVKSIIEKTRNRFNVSIAEIDCQDSHREIVIGIVCVSNEVRHATSIINHVLHFIERNTE